VNKLLKLVDTYQSQPSYGSHCQVTVETSAVTHPITCSVQTNHKLQHNK